MDFMLILNIALGVALGLFIFLAVALILAVTFFGSAFIYKLSKVSN